MITAAAAGFGPHRLGPDPPHVRRLGHPGRPGHRWLRRVHKACMERSVLLFLGARLHPGHLPTDNAEQQRAREQR